MRSGKLYRNECERWEFDGYELTSGSLVEIEIDGHWLLGVIEHWSDGYYWFSKRDSIPVILHSGVSARVPQRKEACQA